MFVVKHNKLMALFRHKHRQRHTGMQGNHSSLSLFEQEPSPRLDKCGIQAAGLHCCGPRLLSDVESGKRLGDGSKWFHLNSSIISPSQNAIQILYIYKVKGFSVKVWTIEFDLTSSSGDFLKRILLLLPLGFGFTAKNSSSSFFLCSRFLMISGSTSWGIVVTPPGVGIFLLIRSSMARVSKGSWLGFSGLNGISWGQWAPALQKKEWRMINWVLCIEQPQGDALSLTTGL